GARRRLVFLAVAAGGAPLWVRVGGRPAGRLDLPAVVFPHVADLAVQSRLVALELRRLAGGELAALHTLGDALLLADLAPRDPAVRERGAREEERPARRGCEDPENSPVGHWLPPVV